MYETFAERKWLGGVDNDSVSMESTAIFTAMNGSTPLPTENSSPAPTDIPPAIPEYLGYIACAVAVLFFGTNFIPVKQFKTGDGNSILPSMCVLGCVCVQVCVCVCLCMLA